MYRFITFVWDVQDRETASRTATLSAQLRASDPLWRITVDAPGLLVLCIGADGPAWQTYHLANDSGAVLGMLFKRDSDGVSRASSLLFSNHETRAIIETLGEHLVRNYWGRYVAFLCDPLTRRQHILRDPTGLLPCFAARIQSVDVYFNWLADAVQIGVSRSRIDPDYVRSRLQSRLAYSSRTGLAHVTQVLGGERVTHAQGKTTRALLWNPLHATEPPIENSAHAEKELRCVTQDVVQAWAGRYPSILHALSGGLDSSIVLACLKNVSATVRCLNAVSSGAGDESALARLCAQKAGRQLTEQHRTGATVKLESLLHAPPTPEPSNYMGWLEHIQHEAPVARDLAANAIFTGQGGDEVFARTGAGWAVSDFVRRRGIRLSLFGRAMDAARQEQLSVWNVLHRALSSVRWHPHSEADAPTEAVNTACEDPWMHPALRDTRSHLPCGKRRHAFLLAPIPPTVWDPVTAPIVERVMPLRSQPLIELCLRIPMYTLIEGGWDRALARRAFHSDLPTEIASRRSKGEISEYVLDIFENNLPFIRDLLLHGHLAREEFVDQKQLAELLSMARARRPGLTARMLDYIEIEVWLRSCFATNAYGLT